MKSRPVQYLGLVLLVLASLAVIFLPTGTKPQPESYTISLAAPKPLQELVGSTKKVPDEADAALAAEFKSSETLPGALTVGADQKTATIEDKAATLAEAQGRADRIVKALGTRFKGIKLADAFQTTLATMPTEPLFAIGDLAVFPVKKVNGSAVPAVKLGLDLQGGVNLVLQVRRAQFTYNLATSIGPSARQDLLAKIRAALAQTPADLGLQSVDVSFNPQNDLQVQVRTQAKDQSQFDQQKAALETAIKSIKGASLTAGKAQFYDPNKADAKNGGFSGGDSGQLLNKTVEIIRSRVDKLGVSEPLIQAQQPDRIIVQLPGVNDPQRAISVIGQTAQMEIRLLPPNLVPMEDPKDPNNTLFADAKTRNPVDPATARTQSELIVSGEDVKPNTTAGFTEGGKPAIFFELQGPGAQRFAEVTTQVARQNRFIPIFLDDRCISAPTVESPITGGKGQISGGFASIQEANNLALLLNSGALPAPIDVVQNQTVSATLGQDSLVKSLHAGLIGLGAVAVFMIVFYRLPGMLANAALVVYCVLNLAVFVLVGGTLTLPGIAGFLLALAMSLDTNILVFERLKEEMAIQPTFAAALRAAFSRAWTAILDSHVTTLVAASVLFYFGSGPVKGFALTLAIGVLLSLFSAISVTRLFMWSVAKSGEKNRSLFAGKLPEVSGTPATRS
jgi:SecD/SecF fusion protein